MIPPGEMLSGRQIEECPREVVSQTLQALQDRHLPAFEAQLDEALQGEHDLDSLADCQQQIVALGQELKALTRNDHTYTLHTKKDNAEFDRLSEALVKTAASLDKVREEIHEKKEGTPPGWGTKLLTHVGGILGIVVGVLLMIGFAQLAIPAAAAMTLSGAAGTLAYVAGLTAERAAEARMRPYVSGQARAEQLDSLKVMLMRAERDLAIANIRDQLTPEAAKYHARLLTPCEVDASGNPVPVVPGAPMHTGQTIRFIGDNDGQDFSALLAALQSGYVSLNEQGQALLAKGLLAEAEFANGGNGNFKEYQEHIDIRALLVELQRCVTYREGFEDLIFVGDLCHDRFSSNKDASREIREALRARGVVFVFGNHDARQVARDEHGGVRSDPQFGVYAQDGATIEQWLKHEEAVFVRCHYDEKTGLLVVHHGLVLGPNGTIQTPWGYVEFTGNPRDLADAINNRQFVTIPRAADELELHHKIQVLMALDPLERGEFMIQASELEDLPRGTVGGWSAKERDKVATWLDTHKNDIESSSGGWQRALNAYHRAEDKLTHQTRFRPTIEQTRAVAKAFAKFGQPVTIAKGHSETQESGDHVVSANARVKVKVKDKNNEEREEVIMQPAAYLIRGPLDRPGAPKVNPWLALPRVVPAKKASKKQEPQDGKVQDARDAKVQDPQGGKVAGNAQALVSAGPAKRPAPSSNVLTWTMTLPPKSS